MIDLIQRFRKKSAPALRVYRVPVYWEMWGILNVKAHTKKEAVGFARSPEAPLPEESYYLEGSVEVDRKGVEICGTDDSDEDLPYADELDNNEIPDNEKSIQIFWDDLTSEARQKIFNLLGNNGNFDVFPITEILKGAE